MTTDDFAYIIRRAKERCDKHMETYYSHSDEYKKLDAVRTALDFILAEVKNFHIHERK